MDQELKPTIRFNEYTEKWNSKKLNEIASFSKGKGISKSDISENGINECIRYGELYTQYGEVINKIHSKTNLDKSQLVISKENDVIIPASGESSIDIATASCVKKSGVILGGDLNIIRSSTDGIFLSYYLNSKKKRDIARLSQGISVIHLYSNQLKSLTLNLPRIEEQQKIASFISLIDKRISLLKEKESLLGEYKKGIMQKLFSQELRFKDKNGNPYPSWGRKNVLDISSMKARIGWQNLRKEEHLETGEYNLVTGTDFEFNKVNWNRTKYVDYERYIQDKHIILKEGDILITKDGSIGKVALVNNIGDRKATLNNGIFRIRIAEENPTFIYYSFLSRGFKKFIHNIAGGSSITHLYQKDFETFNLEIPCLEEQTKIANFLSSLDSKIELVNTQIEKTREFKKGLLQQMFV